MSEQKRGNADHDEGTAEVRGDVRERSNGRCLFKPCNTDKGLANSGHLQTGHDKTGYAEPRRIGVKEGHSSLRRRTGPSQELTAIDSVHKVACTINN